MIPTVGGLWKADDVEVQVYDANERTVFFRYVHGVPAGMDSAIGSTPLASFLDRYSEVDVFAAQHPAVKAGEELWNRTNPARRVVVLSVLNAVVTFEHQYKDKPGVVDALREADFLKTYTSRVSTPAETTDLSGWPTHALFKFNDQSNTLHYHSWTDAGRNPRQTYPDMALLKVPIDWSQATWEVEPA